MRRRKRIVDGRGCRVVVHFQITRSTVVRRRKKMQSGGSTCGFVHHAE